MYVCAVFNIFKHLLWNYWADWSQISYGASLGLTPPTFGCLFCSILFSHLTTPSRFTAVKKWKFPQEKYARLYCEFIMIVTPNWELFWLMSILRLLFWHKDMSWDCSTTLQKPLKSTYPITVSSVMEDFLSDLGKIRNRIRGGLVNTKARVFIFFFFLVSFQREHYWSK